MSTPHGVRIPRGRTPLPETADHPSDSAGPLAAGALEEHRRNVAGSQRAIRLALVFVVALAALYAAFVLYDSRGPGASASPEANGVLVLSAIFLAFAVGGVLFTLTPAPRSVEVAADRVVVVGRWGRRVVLPRLDLLKSKVLRKYPANWLAGLDVELIEVWSEGIPPRSYLVESGLFSGSGA